MKLGDNFYIFYNQRSFREKLLLVPLSFAIWYILYYLIFLLPIGEIVQDRVRRFSDQTDKLSIIKKQISLLNTMLNSKLYREWNVQNNVLKNIQKQYDFLIKDSATDTQQIIKLILFPQQYVNILEIKNIPSTPYELDKQVNFKKQLYYKPYVISLTAQFKNFYAYMRQLESLLQRVQWDRLDYQVDVYPYAKIDVEFSTLYEKT